MKSATNLILSLIILLLATPGASQTLTNEQALGIVDGCLQEGLLSQKGYDLFGHQLHDDKEIKIGWGYRNYRFPKTHKPLTKVTIAAFLRDASRLDMYQRIGLTKDLWTDFIRMRRDINKYHDRLIMPMANRWATKSKDQRASSKDYQFEASLSNETGILEDAMLARFIRVDIHRPPEPEYQGCSSTRFSQLGKTGLRILPLLIKTKLIDQEMASQVEANLKHIPYPLEWEILNEVWRLLKDQHDRPQVIAEELKLMTWLHQQGIVEDDQWAAHKKATTDSTSIYDLDFINYCKEAFIMVVEEPTFGTEQWFQNFIQEVKTILPELEVDSFTAKVYTYPGYYSECCAAYLTMVTQDQEYRLTDHVPPLRLPLFWNKRLLYDGIKEYHQIINKWLIDHGSNKRLYDLYRDAPIAGGGWVRKYAYILVEPEVYDKLRTFKTYYRFEDQPPVIGNKALWKIILPYQAVGIIPKEGAPNYYEVKQIFASVDRYLTPGQVVNRFFMKVDVWGESWRQNWNTQEYMEDFLKYIRWKGKNKFRPQNIKFKSRQQQGQKVYDLSFTAGSKTYTITLPETEGWPPKELYESINKVLEERKVQQRVYLLYENDEENVKIIGYLTPKEYQRFLDAQK